jgi:putative ABC transport system permease protein
MLNVDTWQEIFETVRRNKLRTALTAFSVAWGIFMLVILLAAGTGLQRGVEHDFRDDALNSIWIHAGRTSLAHDGRGPGRHIRLTNDDYEKVRAVPGVDRITGRFHLWGNYAVGYENRVSSFDVRGTHGDHQYLEKTEIIAGRFLNDLDVREKRKVAVIGPEVSKFLFRGESPLGKHISINHVQYQVVGVYEDQGGEGELRKIYIPISTAQLVYNGQNRVHTLMFTLGDADIETSKVIEADVRTLLHERHDIAPNDSSALRINNNLERFQKISAIFDWIRIFVWIVGCGTVVAGIVGVSNIMFISVRERTKEIGIRKALGATRASLIGLVMREAILITAAAGYLGLLGAIGVVELVRELVPENQYIRDPEVDLTVGLLATALIITAGALAGFFPARSAARVNPIVALRSS